METSAAAQTSWPAAEVAMRATAALIPYARNAKRHPPEQIEQIAASIRMFGFTVPVLVDEAGGIIAGHGRVMAAQALGLPEVPTTTARGWSEDMKRAYVLADNKLTENAEWDDDLLRLELGELRDAGFDIAMTGFGADELEAIFNEEDGGLGEASQSGALAERFGVPPFSVLNAREGWWQDRKRAWISLGIRSEVGRGESLLKFSETAEHFGYDRAPKKGGLLGLAPAEKIAGMKAPGQKRQSAEEKHRRRSSALAGTGLGKAGPRRLLKKGGADGKAG